MPQGGRRAIRLPFSISIRINLNSSNSSGACREAAWRMASFGGEEAEGNGRGSVVQCER